MKTDIVREQHPLTGRTVILKSSNKNLDGQKFWIEDWVVNMPGNKSWQDMDVNVTALRYAMRSAEDIPIDDEVLYGKIGAYGHMVHVSELGEVTDDPVKYSSYNRVGNKERL